MLKESYFLVQIYSVYGDIHEVQYKLFVLKTNNKFCKGAFLTFALKHYCI